LFVADISDEVQPSLLGSTMLTDYNGLIYPYDNDHLISIGKVVVKNGNENIMKDLKISAYNISNPTEPVETFYATMGERGTDSSVFYDKKSFWFDSELNMLALPVNLYLLPDGTKTEPTDITQGELSYVGEYFYSIDNGVITYTGRATHIPETAFTNGYTGDSAKTIRRTVRKGNYIYAVSDSGVSVFTADNINSKIKLDF
jgi:hypothetical protein